VSAGLVNGESPVLAIVAISVSGCPGFATLASATATSIFSPAL
jgi:hypothetical protein